METFTCCRRRFIFFGSIVGVLALTTILTASNYLRRTSWARAKEPLPRLMSYTFNNSGGPHSPPHGPTAQLSPAPTGLAKSRESPLDYEFVIAHYNEGLDWLRPIANRSHVYHKGKDETPPFAIRKWERLPNVGREAHTYLYHILSNYESLADVTVFLQGHGSRPDVPFCYPEPMDFVVHAKKNVFCIESFKYSNWNRINHIGKWRKDLDAGRMRRANLTVGEFYKTLFGSPHPDQVIRCSVGCFSATRENLRRHPPGFYRTAISFLDDHSNPEEGHYMERFWKIIITPE
ncbi:uncharacterized protein LOC110975586 [Acanthaster planci]|uniref:Uncharacterized protein LOC110975586 n=1 Tax=Acanthaster planci TaxID=133434 RepID=A0A8B7XSM3_ACAPL|nr:uncharacterized protein LOC110975586 [Acanthaster planci]